MRTTSTVDDEFLGFRPLPARGVIVTNDIVNAIRRAGGRGRRLGADQVRQRDGDERSEEHGSAVSPRAAIMTPVHPGEVLKEEFLVPMGLSQNRIALATGVPPRRINEIVHGTRRITADTALRLARLFGTTPMFWMNLQIRYDLEIQQEVMGPELAAISPLA